MEKIALFGTSADPPTVGHQTILHWLSSHYDRVVVWASDNPFKQHQTPLIYRTEMLDIAIADINLVHNNINLHPELSDRRTLITVNKAREKWGEEVEFTLVIGSDILSQITSWYRSEELLQQVKVLVVPRLGYGIKDKDLIALKEVGGIFAIASLNAPKVSSSMYRLYKDKSLVIPEVNNYIWQKNLYNVKEEVASSK
ncbi:MAG: nicotinate-nucleotide adenylyltransferase [Pleurocapsa sp.]